MFKGQSQTDKITKIREELEKKKAKAFVVTMLDETAWLFNLRGSDIEYNPGTLQFIYAPFLFLFLSLQSSSHMPLSLRILLSYLSRMISLLKIYTSHLAAPSKSDRTIPFTIICARYQAPSN